MRSSQDSRFQIRFGTRTLIFAVLISALVLWFARSELHRRSIESQAVREFERCGGTVSDFVYQIDSQGRLAPDYSDRPEPPILDHLFGESSARGVLQIELRHCDNANEVFTYLPLFVNTRIIYINDSEFCDLHLLRCSQLTRVERLDLADTQISNAGLLALKDWTHLQQLDLSGTNVTDDGLKHLSGLTSLERLTLQDTKFIGSGLFYLRHLQLEWLNVSNTRIDDKDIPSLMALNSLEMLDIKNTLISEEGVNELKQGLPQTDIWDGR
jgi:hypothetical protein